jgi:hypothetical protein
MGTGQPGFHVVPRISAASGPGIGDTRPAKRIRSREGEDVGGGTVGIGELPLAAVDVAGDAAAAAPYEARHAEPSKSASAATNASGRAGAIGTGV